jgi:hypothetical protein
MRTKILPCVLLCAPLIFGACGGQTNANDTAAINNAPAPVATAPVQATPTPQAEVVTASADAVQLGAGGAGEAVVRLNIADGFHVNANPASDKFYRATEIQAAPQEGITPGKPTYPRAILKKFEFAQTPLAVYEKQVVIRLPLRADKSAAKGLHTFRAKISVQPCNDQECLRPRDIDASIAVTIN